MTIAAGFYTYISNISAITDLVSTRIYPSQAPDSAAVPYIIYQAISSRRFPHLSGSSGMVRARVQLDVYAATLDAADSIAEALRDNLDGLRNDTMGSVDVLAVNLEEQFFDLTPPFDGSDPGTHRVTLDFIVIYGESLPSV